ncbi:MAG: sigma-70 family RNA polymerase sigma factor [Bryobacteraceae bacterium]
MNFLLSLIFAAIDAHTEAGLVERLKRREGSAMGELYDRYGKLVYSVILRMVREQSVAEDLTQEAFLRVWNRVQFFDAEKGALGPWILAVARNRAIDHLRSAANRMSGKSTDIDAPIEHPEAFINLERDIINSDHARVLRLAMSKLSDKQREVIELAYYEGLSQSEMAERMNQPLGSVKSWVRTALKILRSELEEVVSV